MPPSDQDRARAFAERREIRFPELAREIAAKVRDKARACSTASGPSGAEIHFGCKGAGRAGDRRQARSGQGDRTLCAPRPI
jgi:hypothetical protein